uniref:Ribonuclease HII n=1 Tax=viral metagenome TaxID=1070528 RepID=A0A6C0C350_9ZZZZ
MLQYSYGENKYTYEISIDEVGRGCMFGDVVVASTILPKHCNFDISNIKDSKKFTSKTKLYNESENIKQNALHYHIASLSNTIIDEVNILQAVMLGMHKCIDSSIEYLQNITNNNLDYSKILLVIDGNYFNPYFTSDGTQIDHITVKQGDGKYVGIAAASILAKTGRDKDIYDLCEEYPLLKTYYNIHKNVGYGAKVHMDGIRQYGITSMHRKSFGICKTSELNEVIYTTEK